jgi:TorA maturation chaperone TorD
MLRYLAEARDTSQHKLLQKHLLPILKQLALEEFESHRVKPS